MKSLRYTSKSVFVETNTRLLVLRGYHYKQITIGTLDDGIFRQIFQYISSQFYLTSLELSSNGITIYCGILLDVNKYPLEADLDKKFENHLKYIVPSNLEYNSISGYDFPLVFLEQKEKGRINHPNIISLYDLKVTHYHSSILKMLLEHNARVFFSSISGNQSPAFNFSIVISNSPSSQDLDGIITILRQSPYLSGKIYQYKTKEIRQSPGLFSLGITRHSITSPCFLNFLDLIPSVLPDVKSRLIPKPFPKISLGSPNFDHKDVNPTPVTSMKTQLEQNEFIQRLEMIGWKIQTSKSTPSYDLVICQNRQMVIGIIASLRDLSLDPKSIQETTIDLLFILDDDNLDISSIHHDWVVIPRKIQTLDALFS